MTFLYIVIGLIIFYYLLKFMKFLFTPAKPAKKSAPKAPPKPRPQADPALQNDPTWLSVSQLGGDLAQSSQPLYASCADRVVRLLQQHISGWQVLYFERPRKRDVEVPADIAALPRHSAYKPDQCIGAIDSDGKVYCIDLFTYNITDQNRKNFCKRLAKELGCGCRLYTAALPNSKGEMVERTLGCIISKNIDRAEETPKKEEPLRIATEDDIAPIPVTVESLDWEEIDEED